VPKYLNKRQKKVNFFDKFIANEFVGNIEIK